MYLHVFWGKISYEALSHYEIYATFALKICDKSKDWSIPG